MAQTQVIEGTTEEIAALLQAGAFAGQKMRVIIEPDEKDFTNDLPAPPNTVRDAAHLEQLLLDGLVSCSRGHGRDVGSEAPGSTPTPRGATAAVSREIDNPCLRRIHRCKAVK